MTKYSPSMIFVEDLINSIALTVTGDKCFRCCGEKISYAGPKSARNILTNLS